MDETELTTEYGIRIGRWSQYLGLGDMPFSAMWCEVPAHGESAIDSHPEVELAVVVSGDATFSVNGHEIAAPRGSAMLLHPHESHVIRAQETPVRVLSLYWLPETRTADNAT